MSLRIAMISEHASPLSTLGGVDCGGQNVYVGQTARHLAAMGHEVDVFTRRTSPEDPESVDYAPGVRVIHVNAGPPALVPKEDLLPHMPAFTAAMKRHMSRASHDVMHAHFWMSGLVAADVKRAFGLPFVITFHALGRVRRLHQGDGDRFPDQRFAIEDRIVAEADAIVAECPQDEDDIIKLYAADPARVVVIPCGFDAGELWPIPKAKARRALGLADDEHVLLQLGRMVPRKGVDNVIRGLARLVNGHGVTARLLVVGGEADDPDPVKTPEIGRLMAIARDEGVADQVVFYGRRGRHELPVFYGAADVFVSTPWYEPFGITPVEAMACGTVVVGSRVGGIKFTVRDGETGFLVPPKDPDALAERLAQLLRNPALREAFARRGVTRANEMFSWSGVAGSLEALYHRVVTAATVRPWGQGVAVPAGARRWSARPGSLAEFHHS